MIDRVSNGPSAVMAGHFSIMVKSFQSYHSLCPIRNRIHPEGEVVLPAKRERNEPEMKGDFANKFLVMRIQAQVSVSSFVCRSLLGETAEMIVTVELPPVLRN
jgi:hypothetical protein